MNNQDGGPAFPQTGKKMRADGKSIDNPGEPGMTLRDYFAAKALQGLLSNPQTAESGTHHKDATFAYAAADAMIAARKERS